MNINSFKTICEMKNFNIEKYEDGSIKRCVKLNEDETYTILGGLDKSVDITIHNKVFDFKGRIYYTCLPSIIHNDFDSVEVDDLIELHLIEQTIEDCTAEEFITFIDGVEFTQSFTPDSQVIDDINTLLSRHPTVSAYISDINEYMYSIAFKSKYPFNGSKNDLSDNLYDFGDTFNHEDYYTIVELRRTIFVVKK